MSEILLPWTDVVVPSGADVSYWDGRSAPPQDVADVGFYVMPYDEGAAPYELLHSMPSLVAVQSLSAGVENILPKLAPGVALANGAGLHDGSVTEHALALILAAQRDLPRWSAAQRRHRWEHAHTRSVQDTRVVLLGHGGIGRSIGVVLRALGAEVVAVASRARDGVHSIADLGQLLPTADILVSTLPDTPSTRGLIGETELAMLADGALVVNVGRGTTVDTDALVRHTTGGRLRAALDVVDPEPLPSEHPLWSVDGVIITPHVGGGSASFVPRAKKFVQEQLQRFVAGQRLHNLVQ